MNKLPTLSEALKSFLVCLFFIVLGYQTKANGFDDTAKYELKLRERPVIKKVTENGKTKNKKQSEFVLRLFKNGKHLIEFDAILDSFYLVVDKNPEECNLYRHEEDEIVRMNFKRKKGDVSIRENYISDSKLGLVGWKKESDFILIQHRKSDDYSGNDFVYGNANGQLFLNLKEKRRCGLYFHEVIHNSLLNDIGNKFLLRAKEYHDWLDSMHHIDNYELLLNDCCNENFKEWKVKLAYLDFPFQNVEVLVDVVCTLCTAPEDEKKKYSIYKAYIDFDDPWFRKFVNEDFRPFFFPEEPILQNHIRIDYQFYKIPKKYKDDFKAED